MRIIIAYVSAGAGHRRCAEALYNYLKENCRNADIKLIDALGKSAALFRNIYSYGYLFLVTHCLWLWRFSFWITSLKPLLAVNYGISSLINRLIADKFAGFLIQQGADFIISTHFLPSEIGAYLKKTRRISSSLITVITDFAVHPFWIYDTTDIYVAACGFTKEQLVKSGVREAKIKEFGIPIETKFLVKYQKGQLCKKFNIEEDKFTVLVVTGSFGFGPIEKIVDMLYRDVQILAVCANNSRLYKRLKDKNYPAVRVFGFVDNIHEMMSVSDIIITKPGGLTIAEVLAVGITPVFISPIPGQETGNIKALARYGAATAHNHLDDAINTILDYKAHPEKLGQISRNLAALRKPFAAQELCNAICQSSSGIGC